MENMTIMVNAKVYIHTIGIILYIQNLKHILACDCDSQGSTGTSCEIGGVCDCKANIMGNKCTNCKPGHYGFPECKGI